MLRQSSRNGEWRIRLQWHEVLGDDDPRWNVGFTVYAYLATNAAEILYIGKCVCNNTVRRRWHYSAKPELWDSITTVCDGHRIIVAEFETEQRLTREQVADVESLLIHRVHALQPLHNVLNTSSRGLYARPGLIIECHGAWPLSWKVFRDH
jgi:hypothetical protein